MPSIVDKSKILRVCVDDFAIKKRYTYGTVMVNWDTHRIIDILPSRETDTVKDWLATYPNLEMISRDGASTYASASKKAHPNALQVTDRFHLCKNLAEIVSQYIKTTFPARIEISCEESESQEMEMLYKTANRRQRILYAKQKYKEGYTIDEIAYLMHSKAKTIKSYISLSDDEIPEDKEIVRERQHREAIEAKQKEIDEVRKLKKEGKSISEIARITHHTPRTVKKYFTIDASSITGQYDLKQTGKLTPYQKKIIEMRAQGITYKEIHQAITEQGYKGSVAAIRVFMQNERAHAKNNSENTKSSKKSATEYIMKKTLCQLVYKELDMVKNITEYQYKTLMQEYPEIAKLYALVKDFNEILFSKKEQEIVSWIKRASKEEKIPDLISFANGLNADLDAVKNAIKYDYNNGLAEGSVTKIKLIKRIMYGRNSFELLKSKVLLHELLYTDSN